MLLRAEITLAVSLLVILPAASARGDPPFGPTSLDDLAADGEIDGEDLPAMRLGSAAPPAGVHGATWVSLVGFTEQYTTGVEGVGAGLVVGLALDRIFAGPTHAVADAAKLPSPVVPPSPPLAPPPVVVDPVSPRFARECVAAALRTSGLGVDDSRLDDIVARARASAWLPETRLRAEREWNDSTEVSVYSPTDPTDAYDAVGANFLLELRLTWRLDRLLYATEEPMIERVRLQRQYERTRLATQILEVLFAWRRARIAIADAPSPSRERTDAEGRAAEAFATLDVLTGGWFSQRQDGF
jgi:hypothetical protein